MRALLVALCPVASIVVASGCGEVDDYVVVHATTLTHELEGARHLVVRNRFGRIRLVPCKGELVTVKAEFKVPESRREQLAGIGTDDLKIGMRSFTATIHGDDRDSLVVECGQAEDPRASGVVADLEITAPATLPWSVWGNAGAISVEGDGNDVSIRADLGTIELTGSVGHVTLDATVSGVSVDVEKLAGGHIEARGDDISLRVRKTGPTEDLTMLTLDGGVAMELPRLLSAQLQLRASLGDIELEGVEGVAAKAERKGHSVEGEVGLGGAKLRVTAEVGDVKLSLRD
jgi:hypothetical protein